jgi:hypothetical protein
VLVTNGAGTGLAFGTVATGGITNLAVTTGKIAANAVDNTKFRQSGALSVVGNATNATANVADITAAADGQVLLRSGTTLAFGTIATTGLTDNSVTYAKMQQIAGLSVPGNPGTTTGNMQTITGTADQVLAVNTAGTALGFTTVATGGITNLAVTTGKIAANAVDNTKIRQSAAVSVVGYATNATANVADITSGGNDLVLRADATNATIGFGQIATGGIAANAVTSAKIGSGAATGGQVLTADGSGNSSFQNSGAQINLGPSSPAILTGTTQNNWNIVGANQGFFKLSANAATTINGIAAPTAPKDGRLIVIVNTTAFAITINGSSGSATAGAKIVIPGGGPVILSQDGSATLIYDTAADSGNGAWRMISGF